MAALAFAGAVAIAPVISGCGAGQVPQTVEPTQLTEGVNVSLPENGTRIDVRNMFLLGPKPGERLDPGARVPLYASIINQTGAQDRLVAVTAEKFGTAKITGGAITLPPRDADGRGSLTNLLGTAQTAAEPSATPTPAKKPKKTESPAAQITATQNTGAGDQPTPGAGGAGAATPSGPAAADARQPLVVLTGLQSPLLGGENLRLTLSFQNAGQVTVVVPVVPQQNEYASYTAVSAGVPRSPAPTTPESPAPTQSGHNGGPGTPGANNDAPTSGGGSPTASPQH
ncbi:hypothetical protein [Actinomadura rayongensis]|uniref:Copper chaperone PCu(A)C n=1 Tax=Actinomadura rayongensis TaxID=1429076 RepID=A0A6I4WC46_9ACTN|nr:hypothetical protein [Actinomadura rayongensis]MXQ66663.1 hypothetical protein [Actinomadura rayongensis]